MENARCTTDNSIYSAEQFADLPRGDFLNRRQRLVCPECERRAFFRGQSQNGRDPHFGARPHAEGCQQRTAQATAGAGDQSGAHARMFDPTKEIVVDFSYDLPDSMGGQSAAMPGVSTEMDDVMAGPEHSLQAESSEISKRHMRLRPLLRRLLTVPEFQHSEQILKLPGMGKVRACDLFVPLQDISARHERLMLGIFGRIVGTQYCAEYQCFWLHTDGFHTPNIRITLDVASFLMYRYELSDIAYLAGANVLVIGAVRVSKNGVRYIHADEPRHIAVDFGGAL